MVSNTMPPRWVSPTLYPFKSNFFQVEAGKIHYIDEGTGPVLLFVHGTPTWSFLYRNFIQTLTTSYRCLAIDHLGFGLSEKPSSFSGTPQAHAQNLSAFIRKMDLQDITLIVHDFGGPIGLSAGIENHHRIKKVILFNTWLWETHTDEDAQKIDRLINSWLGRSLYLYFNFSPKYLIKRGFSNPNVLSKSIHRHYTRPFPNKKSRIALLQLAKSLVGSSEWYQSQWKQLNPLVPKEWLILWGKEDQFIKIDALKKWKKRIPEAQIKQYACGHFVQEEMPQECILEIEQFLQDSQQTKKAAS